MDNIEMAMQRAMEEGVHTTNIAASDIEAGNMKLTLGLVWCIILRSQFGNGSGGQQTAKERLLQWCRDESQGYEYVSIDSFTASFNNGLALCAILDHQLPGRLRLFDKSPLAYSSRTPDSATSNVSAAFQVRPALWLRVLVVSSVRANISD